MSVHHYNRRFLHGVWGWFCDRCKEFVTDKEMKQGTGKD